MTIKLLLVDDQNLVRQGICSLLQLNNQIDVVAQAEDGQQAIHYIGKHIPDIMLLDIRMPIMNGIDVLEYLHSNDIQLPTLILTTFDEHDLVIRCMELGARGYLRKDVSLENLMNAIDTVAAGGHWTHPAAATRVTQQLENTNTLQDTQIEPLTQGEIQILRLVAAGYSNNEIAHAIHKSVGTVRNSMSFILAKLQVRDRTRAVLKAIEYGLI
ncbi:response regulator transcription factor [Teredinibacter sp. KSP-S5-2]|uniref:response regulator transcription factor n=1 Tax=Teredinibacter sp. KSP-S5-2 TaxID=3034506 RepID=UPI0029343B6C|nr:response regulator transcription factor [Teredinibacter sp. KSP-S5-2]WNO10713.1 response regulator transcription factor [Teredinibacter sp. KSP-S5-2]